MAEEKRVTKRKRKLHHGPSSLLRATIQEEGIYDRQVDAFKAKFIKFFDFLDPWQNNVTRNDLIISTPGGLCKNGSVSSPAADESVSSKTRNGETYSPAELGRDLSLEEELEFRLCRMTSIAKSLKCMYLKEKDQRISLYQEVSECKNNSFQLLNDMTGHFHRETGLLQRRLMEMDGTIDEMEHERQSLRQAYEDVVSHATKTVDSLENELDKSETNVSKLTDELNKLRESFVVVEEKNHSFQDETKELRLSVQTLNQKTAELENRALAAERSRDHFEVLLDIALAKLRMMEDGELPVEPSTRNKKSVANNIVSLSSSSTNMQSTAPVGIAFSGTADLASSPRSLGSVSNTTKLRNAQDTQSITSFETLSEASTSTFDTTRVSEDRLSNLSIQSRPLTASPKEPSRRKNNRKKSFFSMAFLKKSQSLEGSAPAGIPGERLPPITDELNERRASQTSLAERPPTREDRPGGRVSFDDSICHHESTSTSAFLSQARCHSIDSLHSSLSLFDVQPVEDLKKIKKVQRTTSFAGLKKNGLVALAKEVEKRFKKKRRAKTTDGTEMLQAKEEYERTHPDFLDQKE